MEHQITKDKIKIECDLSFKERLKLVFSEESEYCFFTHGDCGVFSTPDGPDCAGCIEENVEWIIDE